MSRPKLLKILVATIAVCAGLIAAEIALRFIVPFNYLKPPEPVSDDVWRELVNQRSKIPGLDYELRPNIEKFAQNAMVRTNSYGMRDRERGMKKADGVFRIAVLGDSVTFGFGVENEETYPSVLDRMLNETDSRHKYEVLNFGVGGYSSQDEALVLRYKAIRWNPDLVVIGYVGNDPETEPIQPLHAYFHKPEWWRHSAVLRLMAKTKNTLDILYYGGGNYVRYLHNYPPKWQTVLDAFKDIREVTSKENVKVVVAIFPRGNEVYDKVRAAATEFGFIPVAIREGFSGVSRNETRLPDGHPNKLGHRIIAEVLKNVLISQKLLPGK
jgi:lysophospholipase L1-like esterase